MYPYDHVTGLDILEQTREFPQIEQFTSVLSGQCISQAEWERGEQVFKTFRCKSLAEYHDLYCGADTNLLADCFQNFRELSLKLYELDPAHFNSSPGLTWQAALKYSGVEISLIDGESVLHYPSLKNQNLQISTNLSSWTRQWWEDIQQPTSLTSRPTISICQTTGQRDLTTISCI